jgi:hypothetical protein
MPNAPLLIDAHDAGTLLSMPHARVARLAKRGALPCVVLPDGEIRFRPSDLADWIAKYRHPAQPTEVPQ